MMTQFKIASEGAICTPFVTLLLRRPPLSSVMKAVLEASSLFTAKAKGNVNHIRLHSHHLPLQLIGLLCHCCLETQCRHHQHYHHLVTAPSDFLHCLLVLSWAVAAANHSHSMMAATLAMSDKLTASFVRP